MFVEQSNSLQLRHVAVSIKILYPRRFQEQIGLWWLVTKHEKPWWSMINPLGGMMQGDDRHEVTFNSVLTRPSISRSSMEQWPPEWLDPIQASHLQLATDGESQAKVIQKISLSVPHPLILEKAHASLWEGSSANCAVIIMIVWTRLIMVHLWLWPIAPGVALLVLWNHCHQLLRWVASGTDKNRSCCCFCPLPP